MSHAAGALCVLLTAAALGCGGERGRPAPLDPTTGALQATILQPTANVTLGPGTVISITIAGQDPSLRSLVGLGLAVRRVNGAELETLDSLVILFSAREANSAVFDYEVPAALPFGTTLNVYGIAYGSSERAHESAPRSFFVEDCDVPATACP